MPAIYQPKPCQRCGGVKEAKGECRHAWYCNACQPIAQRAMFRKAFPWYCGACNSPHYCVTCERIKRERKKETDANRKSRSASSYFRPLNAERWWQQRSHSAIQCAVKRGLLPDLKCGEYACTDCGGVAHEYDHRDYGRPFDVDPVCRSCNKQRGTAIWPNAERFQFAKLLPTPAKAAA